MPKAQLLCMSGLLVAALIVAGSPKLAHATPPQPKYATAVVDGNIAEWDTSMDANTDFFGYMYRAGNPAKPIESKAYLRYDCTKHVMYVLVMGRDSVAIVPITQGVPPTAVNWIAINSQNNKVVNEYSGNDGIAPDWAWVGLGYDGDPTHARGYEASFPIAQGTYNIIYHAEVFDGGAMTSAGPGFPGTGPQLVISCPTTGVRTQSWGRLKANYR